MRNVSLGRCCFLFWRVLFRRCGWREDLGGCKQAFFYPFIFPNLPGIVHMRLKDRWGVVLYLGAEVDLDSSLAGVIIIIACVAYTKFSWDSCNGFFRGTFRLFARHTLRVDQYCMSCCGALEPGPEYSVVSHQDMLVCHSRPLNDGCQRLVSLADNEQTWWTVE